MKSEAKSLKCLSARADYKKTEVIKKCFRRCFMSLAGISSTSIAAQPGLLGAFQQRRNDFQQLAQSLQSGDLAAAKAAFTNLSNLSQNSRLGGQSSTSQIGQDFAAVGKALQSGDLAGAQQAFDTFQQDVKAAFQQGFQNSQSQQARQTQQVQQQSSVHHHHHHHGAGNSGESSDNQSAASNGDSISITDASGDKITINLGANSGRANGGPQQVTLNFANSGGPEQVTLNVGGNENITLNFGPASTSASQSVGSQLNVTA